MAKSDREYAVDLAGRWEKEAFDLDQMARRDDYTPLEARMLRCQATAKRGCAQELKLELGKVRRG